MERIAMKVSLRNFVGISAFFATIGLLGGCDDATPGPGTTGQGAPPAAVNGQPAADVPAREWKPDRTVLPIQMPKPPTYTELDVRSVKQKPPHYAVQAPPGAPNVVIVLIDDMGFGVPGTFGGPVAMPTMQRLAQGG